MGLGSSVGVVNDGHDTFSLTGISIYSQDSLGRGGDWREGYPVREGGLTTENPMGIRFPTA
jgi:hypothetical protein